MGECAQHDDQLTPAEFKAIEVHKYYLSEKAGYDVGMNHAIEDWLKNHARGWRRERIVKDNKDQIREIKKHKWIESEKAGRDLGNQAALDWVVNHAENWRRHRETCHIVDSNQ